MKLHRRTWVPLDYLDETSWQSILEKYPFWRDETAYLSDGEIHKKLAYFVMVTSGQPALHGLVHPSSHEFDQVILPEKILGAQDLQSTLSQWHLAHESHFGRGRMLKCGFYCVAPGGSCGYHVDGSVLNVGERVDLSKSSEWDSIIMTQISHRTILPLRLNPEDQFMIAGLNVRMTPGLLFEFSNTLPHAVYNNGKNFMVLLVTTWAAEADMLQHTFADLR